MNIQGLTIKTKKLGLIVNPVAGMGGAVGLKGTDGKAILQQAIKLGAKRVAIERAQSFLTELALTKEHLKLIVGSGDMGQNQAEACGFTYQAVGESKQETSPQDTVNVAGRIVNERADILVFCGGDGTAKDILKAVKLQVPVLGVPTGVKMHSAVFAISPQAAARIAVSFLRGELPLRETEVMDIDEEAFRQGHVSAQLFGYLLCPFEPHLTQGNKIESPFTENEVENQAAIAISLIEQMQPQTVYIIGPGTTTRTIADLLDEKKTLLGVDLFENKKVISRDVSEKQILRVIDKNEAWIIVTPIGGQGFIFGRGNQQISATVIRKVGFDKIIVVATKSKLDKLTTLRVDTGDPDLDREFRARGVRVFTDYRTSQQVSVQ